MSQFKDIQPEEGLLGVGELSVSALSHLCSGSLSEATALKVRPGGGNVSNLLSYRTDVESCFKKTKEKAE